MTLFMSWKKVVPNYPSVNIEGERHNFIIHASPRGWRRLPLLKSLPYWTGC